VAKNVGSAPEVPATEVRNRAYDEMASVLGLQAGTTDPNRVYRWVNRSAVKTARARMKGYSVVKKGEVETLVDVESGPDDSLIAGDLVLMSVEKDVFLARKKREVELAIARTQQAGDDTLQKGKKLGIRTIRETSDD